MSADGQAKFWLDPEVELAKNAGLSSVDIRELAKVVEESIAMNSSKHGVGTSVEVTHIDRHGLWLLVQEREYFLDHAAFPWFHDAKVGDVLDVHLVGEDHLHWPALDVDLCLDSIEHPGSYPLVYH
jgi:hypothetical protein